MTKNKTQKPPRTIEEIVEDLRSKGELDEEKWEYLQDRWSYGCKEMKKGYVIPFILFVWMIFRGCESNVCVSLYALAIPLIPFLVMKLVRGMAFKNIYIGTYGVVKEAVVEHVKNTKYRGEDEQKVICISEGDTYHLEFLVERAPQYRCRKGDKITIQIDPRKKLDTRIFNKDIDGKFNLRKEK